MRWTFCRFFRRRPAHFSANSRLYNPRRDDWRQHFAFSGPEIIGLTPAGRATVRLLRMNDYRRLSLRTELMSLGDLRPEET